GTAGVKGAITANAGAGGGKGGNVSVTAGTTTTGQIQLLSGGDIQANAMSSSDNSKESDGGKITLIAPQRIGVASDAAVTLSANGANVGKGGEVTLTGPVSGSLQIGAGLGQITISATGG